MSKERIINLKVLKDAQKPFTPGPSVDTEIKHMLKLLDIPEEDFFSEDFKPEDYNLTEEDLEHFIEPDIYESRISHDYGLASLVFKFLGGHKVTGEAYDALASHFQPGSIDDGGCGWLVEKKKIGNTLIIVCIDLLAILTSRELYSCTESFIIV